MVLPPCAASAPKRGPGGSFLRQSSRPVASTRLVRARGLRARRTATGSAGSASAVSLAGGGSVTTRLPPTVKNPTAHSAVVAGGPNDRAVTSVERATEVRLPGQFLGPPLGDPATLAEPEGVDRLPQELAASLLGIQEHDRRERERRREHEPGQATTGTQVENAPRAVGSNMAARSAACSIWRTTGPGPKNPRRCASARSVSRSDPVTRVAAPPDDGGLRLRTRSRHRRSRRRCRAPPSGRKPTSAPGASAGRSRGPRSPTRG